MFTLLMWQSISTTLGWYALVLNTNNPALTITPTNLTLSAVQETDTTLMSFKQIAIPILQGTTPELRSGSSTLVVSLPERGGAYYVASMTPFATQFATNPAFSQEFKDIICTDTHQSLLGNPCDSNHAFIATMLSINPEEVSPLSARGTKIMHMSFTSLKNLYVAADTSIIYALETDNYTGFLTYSPTVALAFIFDSAGNEYELSFQSMSEEDILQVMQGITPELPE